MTPTEAPSAPPAQGGVPSGPAKPDPRRPLEWDNAQLDARELSRLKWRTRRGLLENDLFIARFFLKYESQLRVRHANGLNALMRLADNDLLDLHLGRKTIAEVQADLDTEEAREVLIMLKEKK